MSWWGGGTKREEGVGRGRGVGMGRGGGNGKRGERGQGARALEMKGVNGNGGERGSKKTTNLCLFRSLIHSACFPIYLYLCVGVEQRAPNDDKERAIL